MTDRKLTPDDARALLSDHVEGALDEDTRAEVDALLAQNPALAAERKRLETTMSMLRALPRPEAPADMVGKVRDKLAAERRKASEPVADEPLAKVVRPAWKRWAGVEAAIGFAAAASIAIFIAVAGVPGGGNNAGDTGAAGIGADTQAVSATLVVPGMATDVVAKLATDAGMKSVAPNVYEGDRRAAARFMLALKTAAAEKGVEVSGFLPDAEALRIEVRAQ